MLLIKKVHSTGTLNMEQNENTEVSKSVISIRVKLDITDSKGRFRLGGLSFLSKLFEDLKKSL